MKGIRESDLELLSRMSYTVADLGHPTLFLKYSSQDDEIASRDFEIGCQDLDTEHRYIEIMISRHDPVTSIVSCIRRLILRMLNYEYLNHLNHFFHSI